MLMPFSSIYPWQHKAQRDLEARLFAQVEAATFPCVDTKAALASNGGSFKPIDYRIERTGRAL